MTMLECLKKKPLPSGSDIRKTLFGDMPWEGWAGQGDQQPVPPWSDFKAAHSALQAGRKDEAAAILRKIAETRGIEPRHYLQAWQFLRQLGVNPAPASAKQLYGVVVEAAMPTGLDLVACYSDHTARYYNFSGAAVVWERPDASLDAPIDDLMAKGRRVVEKIGVWKEKRLPQPPKGQIRINFLTPSGLHFGQAPFQALERDAHGGPVVVSATSLMRALIQKSRKY
jgi:hypothetical protein